jgi:HAD superfamily hydrolase (TIGR01450 family)
MLLIVDLDGVVYIGSSPVPGVPQVLSARAALGDPVVYATNNSRWHRSDYIDRLQGMGAPVSPEAIVSVARATALLLAEGPERPRCVMVLGGPGLSREMRDVGLHAVAPSAHGLAQNPDVVVVGVDFGLRYERLSIAADAVRRGARFVATNRDPVYPSSRGLSAGAGSIVAAVVVAGGREPDIVIGKPGPRLFETAAATVGVPVREAVVIGDGLNTDIAAAHAVGARSVLMLTGVTDQAQVDMAPAAQRPTAVAHDAAELAAILERFADHGA